MYLRCGEQWRRRYVLGEKIPPGVALVKGGAVHKAAEVNYAQKVESHADLPASDLVAAAAAHVGDVIQNEGLMLAPDETARGVAKVKGEIVDRAVVLTKLFAERVAPSVQPALVEQFVTIELPNHTHDLLGRLDVTDTGDRIRDLKTAGRRKTQDDVDRSDQLTYYDAAFRKLTGRAPAGVTMDVLLDLKKPDVQTLHSSRDDKDRQVFLNRLNAMLAGVKAGSFPPAPLGAWCCSPKWCGYWFTCGFVNAERKAAAEAQEVAV
jgi:hypothetical protein